MFFTLVESFKLGDIQCSFSGNPYKTRQLDKYFDEMQGKIHGGPWVING